MIQKKHQPISLTILMVLLVILTKGQEPELRIPIGHINTIRDAIYDPSGKIIATLAQEDKEVKLWEVRTARLLYTLVGHTAPVNTAAFSNDGQKILTASSDSTFCIWSATNGQLLRQVKAHAGPVEMAVFSTDGTKLVTVSPDKFIRLWDASNGAFVQELAIKWIYYPNKKERQQQIKISGNNILIPASSITELYAFTGQGIGKTGTINSKYAEFSPDGKLILGADNTGGILVADSKTGVLSTTLKEHTKEVTRIDFSPDGKKMISSSKDGTANIWEYPSLKKQQVLNTHFFDYDDADISPDGKLFACKPRGAGKDRVFVIDAVSRSTLHTIKQPAEKVLFAGPGNLLLRLKDRIQVWDTKLGTLKTEIMQVTENRGSVFRFKVSEDGNLLVLQVNNPATELKVFNLQTGQLLSSLGSGFSEMKEFEFSADGNSLILLGSGGGGSENRIWHFKTQASVQDYARAVQTHSGLREAYTESKNSFRLLVRDITKEKIADSLNYKQVVPEFKQPKKLLLSPDGKLVVSLHAGDKGFRFGKDVLVYDLAGKKKILELSFPKTYMQQALLSSTGTFLLLADEKWSYVEVWNLKTGRRICIHDLDNRRGYPLKISKNEQYLVSYNGIYDLLSGEDYFFHSGGMGTNDVSRAGFFDNNTVYTVSGSGVNFWSLPKLNFVSRIWGKPGSVMGLVNEYISSASGNVLLQTGDNELGNWATAQNEKLAVFGRVQTAINSFVFDSSAASFLLVNQGSRRIKFFDAVKAEEINAFAMHAPAGKDTPVIHLLPDRKRLFTTGGEIVQLWDTRKKTPLLTVNKANQHFSFPPFLTPNNDNSRALITYGRYPLFHVLDLNQGTLLYSGEVRSGNYSPVKPAFSPDGSQFMIASGDSLTAYQTNTGSRLYSWAVKFDGKFSNGQAISGVRYSPDGKHFYVFVSEIMASNLTRHSAVDGRALNSIKKYPEVVQSVSDGIQFSADNKLLFVPTRPASAFDISTDREVYPEGLTNYSIKTVSRDRKYILLWGSGDKLFVYATSPLKRLSEIPEPAGRLRQSVFSPDSRKLFTSVTGGVAKQWDISTGKLEKQFKGMDLEGELYTLKNNRYIVARGKNEIAFFDNSSSLEICRYVFFDSGHVVLLPSGYYTVSKENMKKLYYVRGTQTIGFEQLDTRYNRPDKVLAVLAGLFEKDNTTMIRAYQHAYAKRMKKLGVDTSFFEPGYNIPEAEITNRHAIKPEQSDEKLAIRIKAKDNLFALERLNVFIDEVPLFGIKGILVRHRNRKELDTTIQVSLSRGMNRVTVAVTNQNGNESHRSPLLVKYNAAPGAGEEERLYFIGLGIDEFRDAKYNLQYSSKDIRDLTRKLKEKYGRNIVIDTLFNQSLTSGSIKALKKKLSQTSVNDKVIISYSGHGLLSKEYDYYLSTYNINFDKPEQNGLPYDELESLLDSIPARKKLMLIDACHSGEVDKEDLITLNASSDSLIKGFKPVAYKKDEKHLGLKNSFELMQSLFVNVGKSTGATIISAAAGTQFALERNDLKNGVFTYSILEAMNKYPTMKISELKKTVGERVEQLTKGLQKPTSRYETIAVDWNLW